MRVGTATTSGTFGAASVGTNNRGRFTAFPLGAISAFTIGALSPGQQDWKYTNYAYGDAAHKHAVTGLSTGESYSYDANGNMTTRVEGGQTYTQNFDVENRLSSVTVNAQTTTFVYDADGVLIKKVKPDGTSTIYIGSVYEVDLNASGTVTKKTTYYPAGGAMRVDIVGGANTVYYMLKDHLGSASVLLKPDIAPGRV
jgi:YD repeat-containing protein